MPSAEHQEEMPDRDLARLCHPERGKPKLWLAHLCNSLFSYLITKSTQDRRGRLVGEVRMETINNRGKQPGQQHPHSPWKQINLVPAWCSGEHIGFSGETQLRSWFILGEKENTLNCLAQDDQQLSSSLQGTSSPALLIKRQGTILYQVRLLDKASSVLLGARLKIWTCKFLIHCLRLGPTLGCWRRIYLSVLIVL